MAFQIGTSNIAFQIVIIIPAWPQPGNECLWCSFLRAILRCSGEHLGDIIELSESVRWLHKLGKSNSHFKYAFPHGISYCQNIAFQTGIKMHFKFVYYGISSWRFNFALQISIPIWQSTLAFQSGGSTWHLKLALPISIANWHFNLALPKTAQDIQGDSKPQKSMFQDIFRHSRWLKTAKRISLQQL